MNGPFGLVAHVDLFPSERDPRKEHEPPPNSSRRLRISAVVVTATSFDRATTRGPSPFLPYPVGRTRPRPVYPGYILELLKSVVEKTRRRSHRHPIVVIIPARKHSVLRGSNNSAKTSPLVNHSSTIRSYRKNFSGIRCDSSIPYSVEIDWYEEKEVEVSSNSRNNSRTIVY